MTRNLKPLYCAFCRSRIADHHINEQFSGNWYYYRLHCTKCGNSTFVGCTEAEVKA